MKKRLHDYYEEYCENFSYKPLHKNLVFKFDNFLNVKKIPIEQSYEHISEYVDNISVSRRTQRHYKTQLRRYTEYVYQENNWSYNESGLTV